MHRGFFLTWTANGLNRQSFCSNHLFAERDQILQLNSACLRHSDEPICLLDACLKFDRALLRRCARAGHMLSAPREPP